MGDLALATATPERVVTISTADAQTFASVGTKVDGIVTTTITDTESVNVSRVKGTRVTRISSAVVVCNGIVIISKSYDTSLTDSSPKVKGPDACITAKGDGSLALAQVGIAIYAT